MTEHENGNESDLMKNKKSQTVKQRLADYSQQVISLSALQQVILNNIRREIEEIR